MGKTLFSKKKITSHPNPTITNRSTPKIMRDKLYRNTYKDTLLRIKSIISIFKIRLKKNHYKFTISGLEFKSINIGVSNPDNFSIDLKVSGIFKTQFINYLSLISDIYKTLSEMPCDRVDYFTNPNTRTTLQTFVIRSKGQGFIAIVHTLGEVAIP